MAKKKTAKQAKKKVEIKEVYVPKGHFAKNRVSRPPKPHEHLRCKHEHINHRIAEFVYGFIVGAIAMLIAMRMFSMI
jgi:hypothetical protein